VVAGYGKRGGRKRNAPKRKKKKVIPTEEREKRKWVLPKGGKE